MPLRGRPSSGSDGDGPRRFAGGAPQLFDAIVFMAIVHAHNPDMFAFFIY